jgi:uncharacterized protein DUF1572
MSSRALLETVRIMLQRELATVRRSIEAYPDEKSIWSTRPGLPNVGGTLALHLAGNLQHYFGALLGKTGYVRHRDLEFSRRDVPRKELLAGLDAAKLAIDTGMKAVSVDRLSDPYPEQLGGHTLTIGEVIVDMESHLAFHLGQLDYHRRVVTGDQTSVNAVSIAELRPS